jgi:MFS family permease
MAWLSAPAMLGPVIGPPLGGFIVTYFSWRWIFDINVPIGLLGIALVTLFVDDVREPSTSRFDWLGLVLSGISLAGLMFAFETAGRHVMPPLATASIICTGLLAALLYAWHARRHPHPLLDFSLMRIRTFGISVAAGTLFRVGIGAIPFLLPMMLQLGFGQTPAESGLVTFASSAGALLMKPVAQTALTHFGFRQTLVWNGAFAALSLGAFAAFRPSWPLALIYAVLLVGGFSRSLQFTAYNALAYADIPRTAMSAATSLYSTIQQLSLTFGIAAGAASLEASMTFAHHAQPALDDFSVAFAVVAFISLLGAPLSAAMPHAAGDELTGRARPPIAADRR